MAGFLPLASAPLGVASRETSLRLTATEAPDTISVALIVPTEFSLAATEAPDTLAANVHARTDVTLAGNEAQDTFAGAVVATTESALATTEARDQIVVAVAARHDVTLAGNEARDTISAATNVTWLLTVTGGSYTVSGQPVPLLRDYPLSASAATYSVVGQDVPLLRNYLFNVGAGAYSVVSQPMPLSAARKLDARPTSYGHSGFAVKIFQSAFFYGDVEVIYVPWENHSIKVPEQDRAAVYGSPVEDLTEMIYVPWEQNVVLVPAEDRTITLPPGYKVQELYEDRQVEAQARLRAAS